MSSAPSFSLRDKKREFIVSRLLIKEDSISGFLLQVVTENASLGINDRDWRTGHQRVVKAREVTRCYRHSRCVVQGRPRSFPRSTDSRNARNKLVPLDLRRGVAVEKKATRERMCCEKTQGLHYYFPLSLFLTGRGRTPCTSTPPGHIPPSRAPFLFRRQIRERAA